MAESILAHPFISWVGSHFALLSLNDHQGSRDNSACLTEFLGGVNEILDIKHPSCCLAQGQCSVDVIEGI